MANSTDRPLMMPDPHPAGVASAHESDLAAANLSRLRGLFTDAEGICIRVLRADPNNVHAHSLIGDIYRDQGRFEDACQWYQLALDLQPDSRPDQSKLEETRAERDSERQHSAVLSTLVQLGLSTVACLPGLSLAFPGRPTGLGAILSKTEGWRSQAARRGSGPS